MAKIVSRKVLLFLSLPFIVAGLLLYLYLNTDLFNFETYKKLVLSQVEKSTGRKLEVGRVSMQFARGLGLELADVALTGRGDDEPTLKASSIFIKLAIAPLLKKKVVIKKLYLDEPKLSFNLSALMSAQQEEGKTRASFAQMLGSALKKMALFVVAEEVSVKGGEVLLKSRLLGGAELDKSNDSKNGRSDIVEMPRRGFIKISGMVLEAKNFQPGQKAEVSFSAFVAAKGEEFSPAPEEIGASLPVLTQTGRPIPATNISFHGQIENVPEDGDLSKSNIGLNGSIMSLSLKSYAELFGRLKRFEALEGLYNLKFQLTSHKGGSVGGEIEMGAQNMEAYYPEFFASKVDAKKVSFLVAGSYQPGGDIVGDKFRFQADDLTISGKFTLKNIVSPDRYLDVSLSIPGFSFKKHVRLIPLMKIPQNISSFLRERTLDGEVDIVDARLTGELRDFGKKSAYKEKKLIMGKVQFRDVTVLLGDDLYRVSNSYGLAIVDGPRAELSSLRGDYYNSKFFNGRGDVEDLYGEPLLKMWVEAEPDLDQLRGDFASRKKYKEISDFTSDLGMLSGKSTAKVFVVKKFKPETPLLYEGDLFLEGAQADHKAFDLRFADMHGSLHFHNNFVSTENIEGKLGPFPFKASGKYGDLLMKQSFLGADLKDGAELELLYKKIVPFKSGFDFKVVSKVDLGQLKELMPLKFLPNQIAQIMGGLDRLNGQAEASMKFYKPTSVGEVDFDVDATMIGASLRPKAVPINFSAISGQFKLNKLNIKEFWLKGASGGSDLTVEGSVKDYAKANPGLSIKLSASGDFVDIASLAGESSALARKLSGHYLFKLNAAGPVEDIKLDGLLDLSNAGYSLDRRMSKAAGAANLIQLNGRLQGLRELEIEKFIYAIDSDAFFGKGSLSLDGSFSYTLTADWSEIDLAKWATAFELRRIYQIEGKSDGQLAIRGNFLSEIIKKVELKVALKGMKVHRKATPTGAAQEVFFVDGRFSLDDELLNINYLSAKVKDSLFEVRGSIPEFNGNLIDNTIAPLISAFASSASGLTSTRARTSLPDIEIRPAGDGSNLYGFSFPSNWDLEGKASISFLSFRGYNLKDVALQFALSEGVLGVKSLKSSFYGGDLDLFGWITATKGRSDMTFTFNGQIRGADFQTMLADGYPGSEFVGGKLYLSGSLKGQYTGSGPVRKTYQGDVSIKLLKGHLKKYATISNILSLLNIAQLLDFKLPTLQAEGMTFNFITTDFKIDKGVASTDNFYLDSDSLKAFMSGKVDLDNWKCNLQVSVQPLLTVDRFVGSIPFVGRVLAGKEKKFVVSYFNVTGTVQQPKVEPVPLKTVGEGVKGVFKRLFDMPGYIFLGRD